MKRNYILVGLIIIGLLVTGCVTASEARSTAPKYINVVWTERFQPRGEQYEHVLTKFTIPEDNVTCYIASGYYGGHPSCVDGVR